MAVLLLPPDKVSAGKSKVTFIIFLGDSLFLIGKDELKLVRAVCF